MKEEERIRQLEILVKGTDAEKFLEKPKFSLSENQHQKMSKKASKRATCKHCGLESNHHNIRQHHNDNCKIKGKRGDLELIKFREEQRKKKKRKKT